MQRDFSARGGANIGWINASWPFAKLSASPERLTLSVFSLGVYTFTPDQILRLEAYGRIPIFRRGIRLLHTRRDYTAQIIFWCFQNPERIIEEVKRSGFLPNAVVEATPRRAGIPFRWTFLVVSIFLWNLLFFLDGFFPSSKAPPKMPGGFVFSALILVFCATAVIRRSPAAQALVLKPGRSVTEIQHYLSLLRLISGMMLAVLLFIRLSDLQF